MEKDILVIGATGNQGGAVVRQLLPTHFNKIRAFTRDPAGKKAQAFLMTGVKLFKGNLDDTESLLAAMDGAYGVFCAINMMEGGVQKEEERGKRVADAVKKTGVRHFIYSSVGGAERNSGVPHFESKWHIEEYIRSLRLPYTIVRPVAFMDNFTFLPPFLFLSFMRSFLGAKRLQLISVEDIGKWVALAFVNPEFFMGREAEIAGDELNYREIQEIYARVTGKRTMTVAMPATIILKMMGDFGKMFAWFKDYGYQADIEEFRQTIKDSVNFEKFLKEKNKAPVLQGTR